jgi:hypothetical protein
MLSPPSLNSAALLILQQASPLAASTEARKTTPGDDLIATANGLAQQGPSRASTQAEAKISEALFDSSAFDVTAMKINLMRRLGEEFGISLDDHASQASFGTAIKDAIAQIKRQDGGMLVLAAIERKLGLDKLGLSLDTLVNAITDPKGGDAEKLDAALRKQAGVDDEKDSAVEALRTLLRRDETGLYGF